MDVNKVGVVGAGTMGSGIAQVMAASGIDVVLNDIDEAAVKQALSKIGDSFHRLVAKNAMTGSDRAAAVARINASTNLADLSECDVIVEAATENVDLKLKIVADIDSIAKPHAIIASNTSSISLTRIAAATQRPAEIVGMHFFNPVPAMKLVEVIRATQTSDATCDAVKALAQRVGKAPVEVRNSPGFVANRVLLPMLNEAVFCLHEGIASAEDIDQVMKLGVAHPMGPLALADLIGLDVCLSILEVLYEGFGDPKYRPCQLWRGKVEARELGRNTGRGFFDYRQLDNQP
ncbi:MAG: 3-hydroxybutyryl-CoA dehydrogenase [Burkholderiales bacterium]